MSETLIFFLLCRKFALKHTLDPPQICECDLMSNRKSCHASSIKRAPDTFSEEEGIQNTHSSDTEGLSRTAWNDRSQIIIVCRLNGGNG